MLRRSSLGVDEVAEGSKRAVAALPGGGPKDAAFSLALLHAEAAVEAPLVGGDACGFPAAARAAPLDGLLNGLSH